MLSLHSSLKDQMSWLERENPDYFLTYPSNAMELIRQFPNARSKLKNLRELRTVSELVSPEFRKHVSDAWGIPVTDLYSSREAGYVALQCPEHDHYHVQSENLFVEVVDNDGQPCKPGETGWVLVSTLHNYASPLLRYDMGDYAELGEPCDCGRGLPVITRTMGRVRNMAVLPGGERRWPYVHKVYDALRDIYGNDIPVRQVQLVQKSTEKIEVRLATDTPLPDKSEQRLRSVIHGILGHPFTVDFSYLDEIPRQTGGKYEEFMCEVV